MIKEKLFETEFLTKLETSPNDGLTKISIRICLPKRKDRENFMTLCTSEVVEYIEKKYKFMVKNTIQWTTVTNIIDELPSREGVWIFEGHYRINGVEKKEVIKDIIVPKVIDTIDIVNELNDARLEKVEVEQEAKKYKKSKKSN